MFVATSSKICGKGAVDEDVVVVAIICEPQRHSRGSREDHVDLYGRPIVSGISLGGLAAAEANVGRRWRKVASCWGCGCCGCCGCCSCCSSQIEGDFRGLCQLGPRIIFIKEEL